MQGRAGSAVDRFALPRLEVRSDTDADRLLALLAEPATPGCSRSRLNRAAMVLRLAMDGLDRPWGRPAAARAGAARSNDAGNGGAA
jgi:hypothetical protein